MYDEKYINDLIVANAEESLNLEFKSSEAIKDKKELGKDISAFANSAGGIIIYGILEKNHVADSTSFIDGNQFTKEQLEQVINGRIFPKIDGLNIYPIRFGGAIEKSIYVVEIPESNSAPHMTDHRYYKRYNFESIRMEEYEVRRLYFRGRIGKISFSEEIIKPENTQSLGNKLRSIDYKVGFSLINSGQTIETEFLLEVKVPSLG